MKYPIPHPTVLSPRESILSDENEYLELQRLRTLSSGRYGDKNSDYNEEIHDMECWVKLTFHLSLKLSFKIVGVIKIRDLYRKGAADRCLLPVL